jgi:hypothetical protein
LALAGKQTRLPHRDYVFKAHVFVDRFFHESGKDIGWW